MRLHLHIHTYVRTSSLHTHTHTCPCILQGAHGKPLRKEADQLLMDVNLMDKAKVQAGKLSGGMKRKLRYVGKQADPAASFHGPFTEY